MGVDHPERRKVKVRDVDLATKLAKAAVDASEGKEPSPLDTYARALFDSGKTSDAISTVQKAIAVAKNNEMRKQLEETLKKVSGKGGGEMIGTSVSNPAI